jgi:hypothetical protein
VAELEVRQVIPVRSRWSEWIATPTAIDLQDKGAIPKMYAIVSQCTLCMLVKLLQIISWNTVRIDQAINLAFYWRLPVIQFECWFCGRGPKFDRSASATKKPKHCVARQGAAD